MVFKLRYVRIIIYSFKKVVPKIVILFSGYDTIPLDSMQGLEINSQGGGSNYGAPMDVLSSNPLEDFNHLDELPQPPIDNNQVAAWYDTDL